MNKDNEFPVHDVGSYDDQWARLADFIKYNPGSRHRRRIISDVLRPYSNSETSIVDAGCGLGFTVLELSRTLTYSKILGVDFSQVAINGAKKRFPEFDWSQTDLISGTSDIAADIVVCTEVIEHVDDASQLLTNLSSMVNANGLLLLTTQSGKVHATEVLVGHVRHFVMEDLILELEKKGFRVVHKQLWGWPGYVVLKYLINLNPNKAIEKFGNGEYGLFAKILNNFVYFLTKVMSMPNSKNGSQIVLLARKDN